MDPEPTITINGQTLTVGQAMTVRVALESFAMDLTKRGLGNDEHGKAMTHNYRANIDAIRALIFKR